MTSLTDRGDTVVRVAASDHDDVAVTVDAGVGGTVARVGSTGVPALEPLVVVTRDGRSGFYARCSDDRIADIASACLADADVTAADPDAVADHDPAATSLPPVDLPGLDTDRPVLGGCGWRRPESAGDHADAGGFADAEADAVFDAGATLLGRGWGDWCRDRPLVEAWETAAEVDEAPAVVVNGHGSTTDSLLLASAPMEVLDGAMALTDAVDAERLVVYLSEADERAAERVRAAADGYPDPAAAVEVHTGPAVYRAAEPTMALEAIEGNHRLEARLRPPGPDSVGLDGHPTLVHTPRTLAHLSVTLRRDEPPETRVVTVDGDVDTSATVELSADAPLSTALDAVSLTGEFKAACVGGRFGGLTDSLDVRPTPEALTAAGLGTDGRVELLTDDRCLLSFVGKRAQFAADANCGRCVPCREGTTQLAELLRDIYDGAYDPDAVDELTDVMAETSICAFGVDAGRPARTAMESFGAELAAHAEGRCPAGSCPDMLEVSH
ncbi:NADH-ubiquinone oxidoreductase-F iron-sulfur binding region domain-containing protein [Haloarcula marina]|uniref:NADH-ubiquinone oxidoreductase-F iron-sulfur binding region domain-containing protein n=1 Tax=Haloarcula marina TaxID=2961574 RepID=UPI0020B713D6|nr:NADH-ubiquinone oxidoreductase-F iron-sulfur binding region domain-containing protein [Halomicroarcula marina]